MNVPVIERSFHLATVPRTYLSSQRIIFTYYYNRNETETVIADQLKQASNDYVLLGLVEWIRITLNTPAYRLKATLLSDRCQRSR